MIRAGGGGGYDTSVWSKVETKVLTEEHSEFVGALVLQCLRDRSRRQHTECCSDKPSDSERSREALKNSSLLSDEPLRKIHGPKGSQ